MVDKKINYDETGTVFNIQRFSVNDGPGVRTIVFLKGCPLSCLWCSNPESQNPNEELMFNIKNCLGCKRCKDICDVGAIDFNDVNRIDRTKCINCKECSDICYPGALVISGEKKSVEEVIKEVKKDATHFRHSNGGVTLSGGEPLMQPKFTLELLKGFKANAWHTTMETTGFESKEIIDEVIPWLDLVLLDIKHLDSDKHLKNTGQRNEIILENAKRISELGVETIIRIPVIPEFNSDKESIGKIAKFAKTLKMVKEIHILPYHRLGVNKYECIGRKYKIKDSITTPTEEYMEELKKVVENIGIKCNIGAL
ncbi:glycyl-radical enzyme activating protein [Clostridium chauvoei]|uniref:glycyl-radical enzyme activating protein n=1 Tax=Clostridium chauvoei TaxID=46867 RepID=UPI001C84B21D|nr:glycyl-radical enzyme activating protein [Clostridium chauvoei]MBX7355063.1 glycyl-radical enzyme activating protein [Clostridium chauvoei]